jgi:hypothetical protein
VKTSTFLTGLAIAVVIMVAGIVGLLNLHGTSRPEGVAENWLTAVGDTTRKGVEADARKRAAKIGPIAAASAAGLLKYDADRKSAFSDLEVGKSYESRFAGAVDVPFRVHARNGDEDDVEISGTILIRRVKDEWHVVSAAAVVDPAHKLPSEGGPPPSSAPASLWLGGLVGAAIIGVITTSLVRLAGRPTAAAATA